MEGFTFYKGYYETIKKVKKASDRQALLYAMLEFVFENKEPNNLSYIAEIVFETFKKSLAKSKNKSRKDKSTPNQMKINPESNENQNENKSKSNGFQRERPLKGSPLNEKERTKEKDNIYPFKKNPQENEQRARACAEDVCSVGQNAQREFFETYPNIVIDNYSAGDYADIDFGVLLQEFALSKKILQSKRSFKWICSHWTEISKGCYRDWETPKQERTYKPIGAEWDGI